MSEKSSLFQGLPSGSLFRGFQAMMAGVVLSLLVGCETLPPPPPPKVHVEASAEDAMALKQGDVLKISFPGVPTMDTSQTIRADGKISLPMVGEIVAAGKNTDSLTKELLDAYSTKIVSKEVMVSLVSSAYTIYVTGAVLRPGKIVVDHRITAFDAIMEAGGFDKTKADLRAVTIVRDENGQSHSYSINLQQLLSGKPTDPFYLKPFDTVYVGEKFTWF